VAESKEQLFNEAIKLHDKGVDGNKEVVLKAYKLLEKLKQQYPKDLLIEAYYGSSMTLLGRDEIDPIKRFNKASKGLKILDGVVAKAPSNLKVRLLRGHICLKLPEEYFHRNKTAKEDFSYLKSAYERDNSCLSKRTYRQVIANLEKLRSK
jgi:hypothetical protein